LPYYIRLIKYTEKGAEGIKDFSKERLDFLKRAKELGVTVHASYVTLGRYDMVTVLEAPDEGALLKLTAEIVSKKGRTHTETLTAVPAEEFEKILKTL
jgi:uncharacterized protein with GYD domain